MFKPFACFVGLRYTRARKKSHFISFISFTSMLGIGLGIMVLITVLSVMNGFDDEISKRFFGMAPEVTVTGSDGHIEPWQSMEKKLAQYPGVLSVSPFVGGQGLIVEEGHVLPILLTGIDPAKEEKINHLQQKLIVGSMDALSPFGIVLGKGLAENLGVFVGDKVTVMIPQATVTPAGIIPRFKRFSIVGVFSAGTGFNFDTRLAFINLPDAQKLAQLGSGITGFKLKILEPYAAPALSEQISHDFGDRVTVSDWTDQFGEFFQALKLEKRMMFLILVLIIAVAAFNLVSSLVMLVNDKQAEIAILRTLGATPGTILRIFIVQGMMVGIIGTLIGVIGGIILASNATSVVNFIQSFFGIRILSANMYFVDYLPSKIMSTDVIHICLLALMMSFLATLYPAWRASKTEIVEALHAE